MNWLPWIGLGLWVAGILVQIGVGRWTSRLASLEEWRKMLDHDRKVENVEVRLQLIEQRNGMLKEKRQWPRS